MRFLWKGFTNGGSHIASVLAAKPIWIIVDIGIMYFVVFPHSCQCLWI